MQDISLPEVPSLTQHAKFFKKDGRDMVEISYVGSKDTIINKVKPEHMARFKAEWDAYCDGRPMTRRPGTALTEIPGVDQGKTDGYIARNIHNAEELAVLSDGQCQALGHGTLTDRKAAQALLTMRKMQMDTAQRDAVSKAASSITTAPVESKSEEIAALGSKIDAVANGLNSLVALLTAQAEKKKPGRPAKDKADAAG